MAAIFKWNGYTSIYSCLILKPWYFIFLCIIFLCYKTTKMDTKMSFILYQILWKLHLLLISKYHAKTIPITSFCVIVESSCLHLFFLKIQVPSFLCSHLESLEFHRCLFLIKQNLLEIQQITFKRMLMK